MIPAFPLSTALNFSTKKAYDRLVSEYPPLSDLSFATLMVWWNLSKNLQISQLNGNLVIWYELPGDVKNSGLSLIGIKSIEDSISVLLAWQAVHGQPARLVHVPEFVVASLSNQDHFFIERERDYDEYIIAADSIFPLTNACHDMRRKIKKFIANAGEENISLDVLDLSLSDNKQYLLQSTHDWWNDFGAANDLERIEGHAMEISIGLSEELGMKNLCLNVNGSLEGFALYQITHDRKYIILNHLKVRYKLPRIFDFLTYAVAQIAAEQGIDYINMEMDLGIPGLRQHKTELRPIGFFRKYTVVPLGSELTTHKSWPLTAQALSYVSSDAYANPHILT
jgi:hypothetical protein